MLLRNSASGVSYPRPQEPARTYSAKFKIIRKWCCLRQVVFPRLPAEDIGSGFGIVDCSICSSFVEINNPKSLLHNVPIWHEFFDV